MIRAEMLKLDTYPVRIDQPFLVFETGDIFDPGDYEALRDQFPPKEALPGAYADNGNKRFLTNFNPLFFDVLAKSPAWTALFQRFCQPDMVRTMYEIAASTPSTRPEAQQKPWKIVLDPGKVAPSGKRKLTKAAQRLVGRLSNYTPARIAFEFSYLEDGCFIPPHTDDVNKLISLMLYFPDEGLDYGDSAGTEFYRGRGNGPTRSAWKVNMLQSAEAAAFFTQHETFYSSRFEGRKLVGFVKSDISWHGLKQLKLPPGASRRSVNINYYAV